MLWQLGRLNYDPAALALTWSALAVQLPALSALEQTAWEYELLGFSPTQQIMIHYRESLRRAGVLSTWQVKEMAAGQRVAVAGLVVIRQRPETARGILFLSLEDESGLLDGVVKPDVYQRLRPVLQAQALLFTGTVQRSGQAVSLLARTAEALTQGTQRGKVNPIHG